MRYALLCCLLLCGCSSDLSDKYANEARSDLKAVEGIISGLEVSLSSECQKSLESDLNGVYDRIKVIDGKIESSSNACKLEKDVLKSAITKRNWIIAFFGIILIFIMLLKIRSR